MSQLAQHSINEEERVSNYYSAPLPSRALNLHIAVDPLQLLLVDARLADTLLVNCDSHLFHAQTPTTQLQQCSLVFHVAILMWLSGQATAIEEASIRGEDHTSCTRLLLKRDFAAYIRDVVVTPCFSPLSTLWPCLRDTESKSRWMAIGCQILLAQSPSEAHAPNAADKTLSSVLNTSRLDTENPPLAEARNNHNRGAPACHGSSFKVCVSAAHRQSSTALIGKTILADSPAPKSCAANYPAPPQAPFYSVGLFPTPAEEYAQTHNYARLTITSNPYKTFVPLLTLAESPKRTVLGPVGSAADLPDAGCLDARYQHVSRQWLSFIYSVPIAFFSQGPHTWAEETARQLVFESGSLHAFVSAFLAAAGQPNSCISSHITTPSSASEDVISSTVIAFSQKRDQTPHPNATFDESHLWTTSAHPADATPTRHSVSRICLVPNLRNTTPSFTNALRNAVASTNAPFAPAPADRENPKAPIPAIFLTSGQARAPAENARLKNACNATAQLSPIGHRDALSRIETFKRTLKECSARCTPEIPPFTRHRPPSLSQNSLRALELYATFVGKGIATETEHDTLQSLIGVAVAHTAISGNDERHDIIDALISISISEKRLAAAHGKSALPFSLFDECMRFNFSFADHLSRTLAHLIN